MPLGLLDLTRDAGDHHVAAQPDARVSKRASRLHVARERALHVRDPEAVDASVLHETFRLEAADPGEPGLAARVRSVHVAVEHQRGAATLPLPEADDIWTALLDLLPLNVEADVLELLSDPLPHCLLVPGRARDGHEVYREPHQPVGVDLNGN